MRVFWRHWNKLITGEELSPEDHILFDPERDGRRVHGTAAEARP